MKPKLAIVIMAFVLISVKAYNHHLEDVIAYKRLVIEDLYVSNQINLYEPTIACSDSSVKTYMDYRSITSKTSVQYQLIQEFESVNGLMKDREGYIAVALGSWFGELGSRWVFELSNGTKLYTIKVDEKDDKHTFSGCEHKIDRSVIEFIIDTETSVYPIGTNGYILNGNFNNEPTFQGTIINAKKE